MPGRAIKDWTVEYGGGPQPCTVPHAWRQDVDVRWEGPAVYATTVEVPMTGGWLVFDGVSYAARVFLDGKLAMEHFGIWDAFAVPLKGFEGKSVEVRVEVVKNGGSTYPVKDVLSGFLPYVFNTFGGIWREVWLSDDEPNLESKAPPCRVTAKGTKIFVDKKPFYLRGVLTWGWYPELGHPNPSDKEIRREAKIAKDLGFNTIKFCLWVPSHRYFEILEEEGMFAWLELPLWDPNPDTALQEKMFEEMERVVRQYRRHSNIVVWTCGCELSSNTTADYRRRLYEKVKELTGAALVKDNSGSSEMYGGDLREYGDFYDFHPYCDLPFYPVVLDSLLIGPREKKPILLGEFNDIDVHRDLARIKKEQPYWASNDPFLNDQGVRWEKPQLPRILATSRLAGECDSHVLNLQRFWSRSKAEFIRSEVLETVRAREDIAGHVITGWRDTPISSSGMLDSWSEPIDTGPVHWNSKGMLFAIPSRKPPWVNGGNRPGWIDPWNIFEGDFHLRVGAVSERGVTAQFRWILERHDVGRTEKVGEGETDRIRLQAMQQMPIAELKIAGLKKGRHMLVGNFGRLKIVQWLWVFQQPNFARYDDWSLNDPSGCFFGVEFPGGSNRIATQLTPELIEQLRDGARVVLVMQGDATLPRPFWREATYEYPDVDDQKGPIMHELRQLASVSGDRAIDVTALNNLTGGLNDLQVDTLRIDTRTYEEAPILIRAQVGKGTLVATTLRPFGGLGAQPYGVMNNPAGAHLLEKLIELAEEQ